MGWLQGCKVAKGKGNFETWYTGLCIGFALRNTSENETQVKIRMSYNLVWVLSCCPAHNVTLWSH